MDKTLLSPEFHSALFKKHNIYSQTYSAISNSIADYLSSLEEASPQEFEKHKDFFNLLGSSITEEMINTNLDSIRKEIFEYFRGERMLLPDIYLTAQSRAATPSAEDAAVQSSTPSQLITNIDRVNLSAIFMYINRSDISDRLFEAKFIYYSLMAIPGFSALCLILMIIMGFYVYRRLPSAFRWLGVSLGIFGAVAIILSSALLIYERSIMPESIYPITASLPLQSETIASYISDCITPIWAFMLISGVFASILSIVCLNLPFTFSWAQTPLKRLSERAQSILVGTLYALSFAIAFSFIIYRADIIRNDFNTNNFSLAISKMKNANTVTQVISAKDEAIYTLQVKLCDSESGEPVPGIRMNVGGKSSSPENYYNLISEADDKGTARFTLGKGAFRISFVPESFTSEYVVPDPIYCDLKSAGTTIITVELEHVKKNPLEDGIAEIEVLGAGNIPVPGLQLTVEGAALPPGHPDNIFSYTNSEGIAVFKLHEGSYKISFVEAKFPKDYAVPPPLDVEVMSGSVSRYTIRMVGAGR
ncbi:MSCRAMM family protein [Anaerobacterium chartisolvens]|nr:hypothetical protein [Anaerobacterium chartisolvens]